MAEAMDWADVLDRLVAGLDLSQAEAGAAMGAIMRGEPVTVYGDGSQTRSFQYIDDLLTHDEAAEEPTLAYLLSRMAMPEFPEVCGVIRNVRKPTYEELLEAQITEAVGKKGKGKTEDLFKAEDVWTVE